jgi:hypothetical protein
VNDMFESQRRLVWKKAKMSKIEIVICISCAAIVLVIAYALLFPTVDREKQACIDSGKVVKSIHHRGGWICDDK